jgi:hypothetical protein
MIHPNTKSNFCKITNKWEVHGCFYKKQCLIFQDDASQTILAIGNCDLRNGLYKFSSASRLDSEVDQVTIYNQRTHYQPSSLIYDFGTFDIDTSIMLDYIT